MSLRFFSFIVLVIFTAAGPLAERAEGASRGGAARAGANSGRGSGHDGLEIGIEFGARYSGHYNRIRVLSTPPETIMGEAQLVLWYQKFVGFYGLFSYSVKGGKTQMIGGGIKLPFIVLVSSSKKFVKGVALILVADTVKYSLGPVRAPDDYPTAGLAFRYGAGMTWEFAKIGIYLDTSFMVGMFSGNFFVAPLAGIGMKF